MNLYKDYNNMWYFKSKTMPSGSCQIEWVNGSDKPRIIITPVNQTSPVYYDGDCTNLQKEDKSYYTSVQDFKENCNGFFIKSSASGGGVSGVSSVSGRTGDVTLTKNDVGLSNVNNTSDLNKPISTAVQDALNILSNYQSELAEDISNINAYTPLWYGVKIDTTASTYNAIRIGNMQAHKDLPWHNKWRRCLLNDDGIVNYYLDPNNSLLKADGSAAKLDGTDGQWMVEIPSHYERFWTEGNYYNAAISEYNIPGFTYVKTYYVSAGEATVQRSLSKLACVINTSVDYRGGNNSATNDANDKTLLGKPASYISRTNFRAYARNRGSIKWNCNLYDVQRILFWAYVIEYANTNCQLAYNSTLTAEGYKQGGLGNGVTDINSTFWNTWIAYNPFIPIGHTTSLGNKTGVISYQMPASYQVVAGSPTTPVATSSISYRGIEQPFGHLWKWTDQLNIMIQSVADGGLSKIYYSSNPADFNDANYTNYSYIGDLPNVNGYIKTILDGPNGHMLPLNTTGASSTTYYCDNFYTNIPGSGTVLRGSRFGGFAHDGDVAGLACVFVASTPGSATANVGSRLTYIKD